ncbi:Bug family tripartite tricarboxylate transporter substrate binding protein [Bordetella flabilis]|uniref:LacI family transcriptional regulator n=1 Tax=Bordetella flabilis TaxID=463014 RepID=A0A193GET4_9BORD|nr:tripartite tricarboxylate transporter substrate binding protein [Bordetella flabilis]ANN77961.1 LacI family transcriptional regulator [Bordetella flabilis]
MAYPFRKRWTALACTLAAGLSLAQPSMAKYPDHPIRIELPYSPGGGADTVGRPLAVALGKLLDASVVVENKGGASGNIAMSYVAHSRPDGYTLVLPLTAQLAINQSLFAHLPYDPLKDFEPIALIGKAPYVLAVNPAFGPRTLQQFIAKVREAPGRYSYGSTGLGSGLHLSMELLKSMAGLDMIHVPYTGAGAGYTDLLAGRLQAVFAGIGSGKGFFQSGKLVPLGVTTLERSAALPDVPTLSEAGLKGYESYVWYALMAPRGTPKAIVDRLNAAVVAALKLPEVRKEFELDGIEPIGSSPQELTAFIQSEARKWRGVITKAGVTPE